MFMHGVHAHDCCPTTQLDGAVVENQIIVFNFLGSTLESMSEDYRLSLRSEVKNIVLRKSQVKLKQIEQVTLRNYDSDHGMMQTERRDGVSAEVHLTPMDGQVCSILGPNKC